LLLLAFTFYDNSRCGYIKEVDFEEICLISGLNLTRSQARKVTQKVFDKESQFRYNLWTDTQLSVTVRDKILNSLPLATSDNSNLLPVFVYQKKVSDGSGNAHETTEDSVLISVNGTLVDVHKLKDQNEKYESEQNILEANLNAVRNNLTDAQLQVADLKRSSEGWKTEYLRLKECSKTSETLAKARQDDLETFRRATERFFDRVKGVIDVKERSQSSAKETGTGNNGSTSGKENATSSGSGGSSTSKKEVEVKVETKK